MIKPKDFIKEMEKHWTERLGNVSSKALRKVWYQPETESTLAWSLFSTGTIINLFAIDAWNFSMAVYPVSMVFIIGIVTIFVLWKKRPLDFGH